MKAAYGYSSRQGTWLTSASVVWAMASHQQTSPELQARVVETASEYGSYEKAARTATLWSTPISDDLTRLRSSLSPSFPWSS